MQAHGLDVTKARCEAADDRGATIDRQGRRVEGKAGVGVAVQGNAERSWGKGQAKWQWSEHAAGNRQWKRLIPKTGKPSEPEWFSCNESADRQAY